MLNVVKKIYHFIVTKPRILIYRLAEVLLKKRYHYNMEHLICDYNNDFMKDDLFQKGYSKAMEVDPSPEWPEKKWQKNQLGAWVIYTTQWASEYALKLDGDFVECGCYKGRHSISIMEYLNWNKNHNGKIFYLFDTFTGLDESISDSYDINRYIQSYKDFTYESVEKSFSQYKSVNLIKGVVPHSFEQVDIDKVCFLHIDMNSANPEVMALDYFFPKLVPGAIVIFDDYGQPGHEKQKHALDQLCTSYNRKIFTLPTGQGLLIK